jgi:hypothetical protein
MSTEPSLAPQTAAEAAERINHLTGLLNTHWESLDPAETLDRIATLMGQHRALLVVERYPADHPALKAVANERIAHRIEQSYQTVGAGMVAARAETLVYIEHLRSQP